ncbi:hypothetical protein M0802_001720 [Mischocyttarus mexicanus]|nr:hypothetical protein M0802_001720 [Mischocyttarus mexicanus]
MVYTRQSTHDPKSNDPTTDVICNKSIHLCTWIKAKHSQANNKIFFVKLKKSEDDWCKYYELDSVNELVAY